MRKITYILSTVKQNNLTMGRLETMLHNIQMTIYKSNSDNMCNVCGKSDFAANSPDKLHHLRSHLNFILRGHRQLSTAIDHGCTSKLRRPRSVPGRRSSQSIRRKYTKLQQQTPWANGAPLICRICSFATSKLEDLREHHRSPVHIEQEKIISGALIWEELSRLESFPEAEEWNVRDLSALSQANLTSCLAGSSAELEPPPVADETGRRNCDSRDGVATTSNSIDPRFLFHSSTLQSKLGGTMAHPGIIIPASSHQRQTAFACTNCWQLFASRHDLVDHFSIKAVCRPEGFISESQSSSSDGLNSSQSNSANDVAKQGFIEISLGGNGNFPVEIGLGFRRPLFMLDLDDDECSDYELDFSAHKSTIINSGPQDIGSSAPSARPQFTCTHCGKRLRNHSVLHQHIVECGNELFIRDQVAMRRKKENLTKSTALPSACVSTATATIAKMDIELFGGTNGREESPPAVTGNRPEKKPCELKVGKSARQISSNNTNSCGIKVSATTGAGDEKSVIKRRYNTRKAGSVRPVRTTRRLAA